MALFTVTNLDDSGLGSLRDAISLANTTPGADEIEFGSLLGTISLTSGELEITEDLLIDGPGASFLSLSGNNSSRLFFLNNPGTVTIQGLTLTGGNTTGEGGAIFNSSGILTLNETVISGNTAGDDGGAIFNDYGSITITNSTISGNTAGDDGGAIFNFDEVTIIGSTISDNTAGEDGGGINNFDGNLTIIGSVLSSNQAIADDGGAIDNDNGGFVLIQESTLSGNIAGDDGGVIENSGYLYILDSTLSGNTARGVGGAIDNDDGILALINSTISGNSAEDGGGIYNYNFSRADLINSTISDNSAGSGGGIFNSLYASDPNYSGVFNIANTIIANSTGGDCVNNGAIDTNVNNLIEDGSCNPLLSGDPNLGPLQDNGGPTFTQALLPGSIAINAGDNSSVPTDLTFDQRGVGFDRIVDGTVDIGAFEVQSTPPETVPEPSALFGILALGIVTLAIRWRR